MGLLAHMQEMARNNAWSNLRLHRACGELSAAEFAAARTGFFPSLQRTLNHILLVDRAYMAALKGMERPRSESEVPYPRAQDLARVQRQADQDLIDYCNALDPAALTDIVTFHRVDGSAHRESVGAILSHLFVHQIHHRGQAHAMLSSTGVAPPQLDEFFLASDEPLRREDLRDLGF